MCNFEIIFVAGVHGVGKSYFCSKIKETFKLPIFSASSLIKKEKNSDVDSNKNVLDLEKNQDYFIHAINKIDTNSSKIVIDGHFCLLENNQITNIPTQTFEKISLKSIIVLYDSASDIYNRLQQRDKGSFSINIISQMQEQEIMQAEYVAAYLNIPYEKVHFSVAEQCYRIWNIFK
jgi:adenylate kinase